MRVWLRSIIASLVACSAGGGALAEERLVVEPYPASSPWKVVTDKSVGGASLHEQIPSDQNSSDYRDLLSSQSFPRLVGIDPAITLRNLFNTIQSDCDGVRVNGPESVVEAGVPVAYAQVYCGRKAGKDFGVQMFFKVLQGEEALYAVQREFLVPPSPVGGVLRFNKEDAAAGLALFEATAAANTFLRKSVYLCNSVSTRSECKVQASVQ